MTGVTERLFMCQMFMCLFRPPKSPVTIFFKNLFRKLAHIFGKLVLIFGKLAHIFEKLVHIFARKLVSRTWKQVSRNLGPLWQPGVYNDTS